MKVMEALAEAKQIEIEELYTWLYEKDKSCTCEERREHLIRYSIIYHQYHAMQEGMGCKADFIERYLLSRGYSVEY